MAPADILGGGFCARQTNPWGSYTRLPMGQSYSSACTVVTGG